MTSNQVEYAKHLETVRHNKAEEGLTSTDIQEKIRHNKQSEWLTGSDISEKVRHNQQSENIDWFKAANLAGLQSAQAAAVTRQAAAAETSAQGALMRGQAAIDAARYNYELGQRNVEIAQQNADTNWQNSLLTGLGVGIKQQEADARTSQADTSAYLAEISNRTQKETVRHNTMTELQKGIDQAQRAVEYTTDTVLDNLPTSSGRRVGFK